MPVKIIAYDREMFVVRFVKCPGAPYIQKGNVTDDDIRGRKMPVHWGCKICKIIVKRYRGRGKYNGDG